jgi:Gly-Xaa carboxypeptidase
MYATLQCIAEHGKDVPERLRKLIQKSTESDRALKKLESVVLKDNLIKSLVGSTQAIDIVHGGVKSNALPEQAWAVVNHRISVTRLVSSNKPL